jgi:hypothetical protein
MPRRFKGYLKWQSKRKAGRGTPAIIMPTGTIIPGYKDAASLINAVDKASHSVVPKKTD